jgi:hypothetical protein
VKRYDDQKRSWNWRHHKNRSRCSAVSEFRKELDELTFADVWTLNRNELIIMLSIISQFLDKILRKTEYTERLEIHLQHEAVGQLNNLIEALKDLENGKTHDALRPAATKKGAALTAAQKRQDALLVNMVTIVQQWKGFPSRREAEEYVAERLRKGGKKRRGQEITAKMLKSLRDHFKK